MPFEPIDYNSFEYQERIKVNRMFSELYGKIDPLVSGAGIALSAASFAGVDATGATDCTNALNSALAALSPGAVVYFDPGTYVASIRLTVPNVTLTGTWAATIKTPSGATGQVNDACVRILADGVTVEKLRLDGNKDGNAAINDFNLGRWADGVAIYADRATVRGCRILDSIGHKVIVWNEAFAPTSTLKGARRFFTIEGNHITGVGQRASIDVASTDVTAGVSNNGIIRGNIIDDMVMIVHTGTDLLIEGNVVRTESKASVGITIHTNSKRVRVVNNIIGPASSGLTSHGGCEDVAFINNKIFDTLGAGISVDASSRAIVQGNSIHTTGAGAQGILFTGVSGGTISQNSIFGVGGHSIDVNAACTDVLVAQNKSFSPTQYHVNVSSTTNTTVRGNSCAGGVIGVAATSGTNAGLSVTGNDFSGTSANAVYATGQDAFVQGNVILNAGAHAIRVHGQGARVVGNEIRTVTGSGVLLNAAVTGVVITDNRIAGASGAAIAGMQADTVVRRNIGYVTEARASSTIADATSSIAVTHGLAVAPTAVAVTPRGNEALWVSGRTSTNFTVNRAGTSGALGFDWQAEV